MDLSNKIKKNVVLAPFTSFKTGGPANYFIEIDNRKTLLGAVIWAQKKKLPIFILGQGTNLLISDRGFAGLVIKANFNGLKKQDDKIIVGSGVLLSKTLNFCLRNNLSGLEWAAGIPGTIGGAVFGNAGAYGKSISDHIYQIEAMKLGPALQNRYFKKADLKFSYRHSILKEKKGQYILTKIWLTNFKKDKISNKNKNQELIRDRIAKRIACQPTEPSAGCIFKNPPHQSAGFLIENCGLKGYRVGGAQVSEKHANFIINPQKKATAKDVLRLIKLIQSKIKKKFNIDLELEIQYLK